MDGDGDGDVKSTTPLDFSITFLSLITLFLRPIIHRSTFSRPWTLLPFLHVIYRISANFRYAPHSLRANLPSEDYNPLRINGRQARIHAYFQVYPWTPPVVVVRPSVHTTPTRRRQLPLK